MAKRITEHRVRNWIIGGGISGGAITILLLFAFLSSLGSIEVTGYSGDQICQGTLEDPCLAFINFTAKEDIFIYPSENWSEAILETDKSVKSVKMFRSWGTGWREIKLNEVCTGTWCGASGDAKYSFAFRKDKSYTIKYEVLKNSPYDKIKWSFTSEVDPLFDSVADIELISESNSLTYGDAVVKITPKMNFLFQGNKVDTWVDKITSSMDLTRYEMSVGQNTSYQEEVWISDIICNPWTETTANGTIEHAGCVDNGYTDYITKYKIEYVAFEKQNFQLTEGAPIYLKVHGEWPAQLGGVIYDWKIDLDGYVTPFQWWNTSFENLRLFTNITGDIISIDLNYTNFTNAQADWDDLRIVDITNITEYGYFIEQKVDSTNITLRIRVNQDSSFYIYYGDADVSTTSNISDVYGSDLEGIYFLEKTTGDVIDSSGNVNGTNEGADRGVTGKIGNAFDFESGDTTDMVNFGDEFEFDRTDAFSISLWAKRESQTGRNLMTKQDTAPPYHGYKIYHEYTDNTLRFDMTSNFGANNWQQISVPLTMTDEVWHHIVVTYNGNSTTAGMKIYVDGDVGTPTVIKDNLAASILNNINCTLGNRNTGEDGWDGEIDEVGIWSKELNSTEVSWLYNVTEPIYVLGDEESGVPPDASPTINLNTPADAATLTSLDITFNCTAYDDSNLINVSLYIDGSLNETNSSGLNNSNYLFDKTLTSSGSHNWTCQGCDNASQCTTATVRTFNIKLNLTGYVKDDIGNFLSGSFVFIINQSDNSTVTTTFTNGSGYWTYGPCIAGNYAIMAYDPTNSSRDGDAEPWVVIP